MNRPFHRRAWFLFVVAMVGVLLLQSVSLACPTCKDGLAENDPARAGMVRGYFWSILFMMSMPFLILAGLSSYFYLEIRRARGRQARASVEEDTLVSV